MATLTVNAPRTYALGDVSHHPVIADDIVYEGAAVGDNASGYARPLVAGDKFLGFALQKCDNTVSGPLAKAGSAADLNVMLQTRGEILLTVAASALTDHGRAVYASDDDTFTFTAQSAQTANTFVGFVKRYDSTAAKFVVAFDASREGLAQAPLKVTYSIAAQSGNAITVSGQVKYTSGQDVAERRCLAGYLSDSATGDSQGAPADGTAITAAAGTDGLLIEDVANNSFKIVTESDGDFDIALTKVVTGAETVYLVTVLPDGRLQPSAAITFT